MNTPEILPVKRDDTIARVAALADTVWREHYVPIIGAAQVDYMLERFQNAEAVRRQIGEGYDYFLIVAEGDDAGYFAVQPRRNTLFLSKIYVDKRFRGIGAAKAALTFIEAYGLDRGAETLMLTVNRENALAVEWYGRQGFVNTGSVVQDIGGGFVMDDYRMEKALR